MRLREGYLGVCLPSCEVTREPNSKIMLEWVRKQFVRYESTYIFLFLTRHDLSTNDDKNDDFHTSSLFLTRSFYVLVMTSQSVFDDVTNALRDTTTIVTRVREKRCLTCWILILFTAILTAGRVRKCIKSAVTKQGPKWQKKTVFSELRSTK